MNARTPSALRARRLLALLPHLSSGAEIPLRHFAEMLGARPEELASDIGLLSMCGAVPYTPDALVSAFVEDDGVVRAYQPQPALDRPVRLTATEAQALAAALDVAGCGPDDVLRTRLAQAIESVSADPETIVRAAAARGGALHAHRAIATAIAAGETVTLEYWSPSRGEPASRVVHPFELVCDRGSWYLRAWCELAGADRTFRLDRIRAAKATGRPAREPSAAAPAPSSFSPEGLPTAVVRFAPGEDADERDFPGAVFERESDGAVTATIPYAGTGWLARKVAARLGAAEVVSPPEVRRAVAAMARGAAV